MRRTKLKRLCGFTLIEVLIVALILGIVVLLGLPQLGGSVTDARLYAVTNEIVTAIEFAQLSAMSTGRPCRVSFDDVNEMVWVEQLTYTKIADILNPANTELTEDDIEKNNVYLSMEYPMKPGTGYTIDFLSEPWFSGIDIVTVNFGSGNELGFDTSGAPSTGVNIIVAYGERQATLNVDHLTGKVIAQ